jgi:hypothetical protein
MTAKSLRISECGSQHVSRDKKIEALKERLRTLGCTETQIANHLAPTKATFPEQTNDGTPRVPHHVSLYRF